MLLKVCRPWRKHHQVPETHGVSFQPKHPCMAVPKSCSFQPSHVWLDLGVPQAQCRQLQ